MLKMLDCFCGLGGVSDGFASEGFDVTGIDIVDMPSKGYKHRFIQADLKDLKGEDFKNFDVIWGSPPCRDFSVIGLSLGSTWKRKPDPEFGLKAVTTYRKFVNDAQPKIWIMENVWLLCRYYDEKPVFIAKLGKQMLRAFWGTFPHFLMPTTPKKLATCYNDPKKNGEHRFTHMRINGKIPKHESWVRAKIPLACSQAFAKACREALTSNIALVGGIETKRSETI